MKRTESKKGFTIIEVVLVLAIAGLIFLVVFLALPALQRSQRDTQRKQDYSRFMTAVTNYQSNNQGQVPTTNANLTTVIGNYLTNGGPFKDPSNGADYGVTVQTNYTLKPPVGQAYYYINSTCAGQIAAAKTGARNIAVVGYVEQGGTTCFSN